MAIKVNSSEWDARSAAATRSASTPIPSLPREFLTEATSVEEVVVQPRPATRGELAVPGPLDITSDLAPGEAAVLAIRHPSGAITFHAPVETTSRTRGGPAEVRFIAPIPPSEPGTEPASRGLISKAVKAIVIKVGEVVLDKAAGLVLSKLARLFEERSWEKKGLQEGWLKVTKADLAKGRLTPGKPSSTERSLLFIHGTFSNAASAYSSLAQSSFFADVASIYGDRIFAFDHFTLSRTPEENVRMLLTALPDKSFTFDVITHSRGGLVLRNLVERAQVFGDLSSRFTLGRAILVAAPNEGTPLATPSRWENTVGWIANLLEMFPENPFTTGAEFVANGIVWIARHASGDLPGIRSMDGDGELIRELQAPPGPPPDRYSVLAANYSPSGSVLKRMVDTGIDQFFNTANDLVVPSEGGWRVDLSGGAFIPGNRIGCFGPGGNIDRVDVTHVNFFSQPETVTFLVETLSDQPHKLQALDPALRLPDRQLIRAGAPGVAAPAVAVAGWPAAAMRSRFTGRVGRAAPVELATRLNLTVVNGDLTFEQWPLLVGHYRATVLTGTEAVLDGLLDRAMSYALDLGVYPVEPGSHRIFLNRTLRAGKFWQTPRPEAVIVVGLGQEGKLRAAHLLQSVRQAVLAWAERVAERGGRLKPLRLATTLLSSGGTGINAGQAAQLIAQGVHDANVVIRKSAKNREKGDRLPEVHELRFVELYLNRASEAWEALKMQAEAMPARYSVAEPIQAGNGSMRSPIESGYRGADYDFITAETRQDVNGNTLIAYALDTKRARTEVRAQQTQARLLRDLIATASSAQNVDQQIGRTLYNLLVPIELESFLAASGETQIELDEGTAGIPWELLDDTAATNADRLPWAIRSKLLRKYRTETFRAQVADAGADASILVIGEPECPPEYPPLPGALREAKSVLEVLTGDRRFGTSVVKGLFAGASIATQPDARQVVDTLFERSWRIVHVAGHGEQIDVKKGSGGVVLSNGTFLGAAEIKAMRVVPELVFVNCCHLAAGSRRALLRGPGSGAYDRSTFASSVAQALIDIGVRCVIAAGWAVDDEAASAFASTFYDGLLRGQRFIDAVAEARTKAYEYDGNTWAAYQCYGDPEWKLSGQPAAADESRAADPHEFDNIGSIPALDLALENLTVETQFQGKAPERQLARLTLLEDRWRRMRWSGTAVVAERFAKAYAAAGDVASAVRWYETAIENSQGQVSFRMIEQVSNLRIRHSLALANEAYDARERLAHRASEGSRRGRRSPGEPSARQQRADADRRVREATAAARTSIDEEMKRLTQLSALQETVERESLKGSAMKRLAMLETRAGRTAAAKRAVAAMARHYERAVAIAEEQKEGALFYPANNLIAAEVSLNAGGKRWKGLSKALIDKVRKSVQAQNESDPDFWSLIAGPEFTLYEAVAAGRLKKADIDAIERSFRDVSKRSKDVKEWTSVIDTMHFALDPCVARASGPMKKALRDVMHRIEALAKASLPNKS
jgi:CHAT domain-containing protein